MRKQEAKTGENEMKTQVQVILEEARHKPFAEYSKIFRMCEELFPEDIARFACESKPATLA